MKKVGITGGIGSGKTTVCNIFQTLGIPVYSADIRAKWLMSYQAELKLEVKRILGTEAYHGNGRLNRKYVASRIFNNKDLLKQINSIVHPVVHRDAESWFSKQTSPYALYEAALLIENDSYKSMDALIVVTAPQELRVKRVVLRDKTTRKAVEARINNQLPQKEKDALADYLIVNDEKTSLITQIINIHKELLD